MEGHWKFLGGGEVLKAKFMKINWNFRRGGTVQKKLSVGGGGGEGVWIFSGTAHSTQISKTSKYSILKPTMA